VTQHWKPSSDDWRIGVEIRLASLERDINWLDKEILRVKNALKSVLHYFVSNSGGKHP